MADSRSARATSSMASLRNWACNTNLSSWQPAAPSAKCQWRNNMPSIVKPVATHPSLQRNALDLTIRDYEGTMSTLCAGCGHDSITAALTRALWEVATQPHMIAKLSGIGCSSKTPAYFVNGAH